MGRLNFQNSAFFTLVFACLCITFPAQSQKAISIGKSDFLIEKEEILADAKRLIGESEVDSETLNYARSHETFRQKVAKADPPLSQWSDSEQDIIASVPSPSESAQKKLADHRSILDQQQQARVEESEAAAATRRRSNLEQQRLDAIRDREETAAELRKRELDIIEDRYNDGGYYRYGYGFPIFPIHPVRPPHGTPAPTPLYGAGGLVPR